MENIPGVLVYKLSSFLPLNSLLVIELLSAAVRAKMINSLSAYHRALRQHSVDIKDDITICKKYVQEIVDEDRYLVTIKENGKSLIQYDPRTQQEKHIELSWMEYNIHYSTNWINTRMNHLLITGGHREDAISDYSLVDLQTAGWIQSGNMNQARRWHGITKIKDEVYVVLGANQCRTLEKYNERRDEWTLLEAEPPETEYYIYDIQAMSVGAVIYISSCNMDNIYTFDTTTEVYKLFFSIPGKECNKAMLPYKNQLFVIHNQKLTHLDEQGNVVSQRIYKTKDVYEHFVKQKAILIDDKFYFTDYYGKILYSIYMLLDDIQAYSQIYISCYK